MWLATRLAMDTQPIAVLNIRVTHVPDGDHHCIRHLFLSSGFDQADAWDLLENNSASGNRSRLYIEVAAEHKSRNSWESTEALIGRLRTAQVNAGGVLFAILLVQHPARVDVSQ